MSLFLKVHKSAYPGWESGPFSLTRGSLTRFLCGSHQQVRAHCSGTLEPALQALYVERVSVLAVCPCCLNAEAGYPGTQALLGAASGFLAPCRGTDRWKVNPVRMLMGFAGPKPLSLRDLITLLHSLPWKKSPSLRMFRWNISPLKGLKWMFITTAWPVPF